MDRIEGIEKIKTQVISRVSKKDEGVRVLSFIREVAGIGGNGKKER